MLFGPHAALLTGRKLATVLVLLCGTMGETRWGPKPQVTISMNSILLNDMMCLMQLFWQRAWLESASWDMPWMVPPAVLYITWNTWSSWGRTWLKNHWPWHKILWYRVGWRWGVYRRQSLSKLWKHHRDRIRKRTWNGHKRISTLHKILSTDFPFLLFVIGITMVNICQTFSPVCAWCRWITYITMALHYAMQYS